MQKTLKPVNLSELITEDDSRKRIKADKIVFGGRFSGYFLICHPYGDNNPKQRELEGNAVALMAHVFMSLLLVYN